jgi:hypothetical protein
VYLLRVSSAKLRESVYCSTFILFAVYLLSSLFHSTVSAVQESDLVVSPDSKPYGITYGEWSAKWWQWALSIRADKHPIHDIDGRYCGTDQNNPEAWFLAGSGGGQVVRNCTVPGDKALFFPIMNVECSFAEDETAKTEEQLRNCARDDQNTVRNLRLNIDGLEIQNLTKYRTESPLFNFTTPEIGIFNLKSAKSQGVSDGFFVMVKPLSSGSHEITFSGVLGMPTAGKPQNSPEKVTYRLSIE